MPNKIWIEKNKDHLQQYQAQYYLKHIKRLKVYKRKRYQELREQTK